ncbi:hypothetical protein PQF02_gp26 [Streptococcus phage P7952]|uniref:Uncharacterized protein n=1 Tax=Streptococcus phage P7952 TaxID=1971437 RepID=A0A286QRC8_9CAUD|nr:hypothetical protein PQF02_gp26 [Streptococcus phage P7952]ARU14258.1 hypothetical protein P7952_26 [Streptococcus phage P7952]
MAVVVEASALCWGFFCLLFFNLTARNSPTSKVAGCKGFGLVQ